jgi:anthranilate/para-aminobenzoate synthase component I
MSLSAVVVDVDPDPVALAGRLEGRPGFALLHAAANRVGEQRSFLAVDPVESSSSWLPPAEVTGGSPSASRDTRSSVPRWVGCIPYECARSLERRAWTRTPDLRPAPHLVEPKWWRYAAVVEIDPRAGIVRVVGDDARRVSDLARAIGHGAPEATAGARSSGRLRALAEDDPPEAHVERVRRAQELIQAGDLYQVNLARRSRYAASGRPLDLYLAMAAAAPSAFGACLDLGETFVCASSPELFLAVDPRGEIRTAPIKGTRPRGVDASDDRRLVRQLAESPKEQAELTMILDVERNDLGRVAVPGSVRLVRAPAIDTYRTIHHRAAELRSELRNDKSLLDVLKAMFPSGSVTGAPKVRAMEVIATLEPARRGLYTGAFGTVAYDGSLKLAMAIRVLTILNGEAHYFAGGGIVADSDPEAELAETRWKGAQIEALL